MLLCLGPALPGQGEPAIAKLRQAATQLAPGVFYSKQVITLGERTISAHVVLREPGAPYLPIPAVAPKGLKRPETLKGIAEGSEAIAAINGGFFASGGFPIGTIVINGQVASLDSRERSAFGIAGDRRPKIAPIQSRAFVTFDDYFEPIWLWGYNQPLQSDAVVLYNQYLGAETVSVGGRGLELFDGKPLGKAKSGTLKLGGAPPAPVATVETKGEPKRVVISNADIAKRHRQLPPVPTGPLVLGFARSSHEGLARVAAERTLSEAVILPTEWDGTTDLLTAGPIVLADGRPVSQQGNPEGFRADVLGSAKRSLIGIGWSGEVLLIQLTDATTPPEAAQVAIALGCKSALNLDGGGSSGLWVQSAPDSGGEPFSLCANCTGRKLGSAIVLVKDDLKLRKSVPYFDGALFEPQG